MLTITGALIATGALVAGGWFAALAFTSPAQRAAAAGPPPERPITAEVTRGDLAQQQTLPGAVQPESGATIALAAVPDAPRSVVTASPLRAGSQLKAGDVVVRVNGAPVFALASPFAFYRDLGVGDEGPDVAQLQHNLIERGYLSSADGRFGPATARAVHALYRSHGDEAPVRDDPAASTAVSAVQSVPGAAEVPESAGAAPADGVAAAPAHASAYLPYSAVAAVPALPARVAQVPAVGADAASAQVVVASARLVVRVSLTDDARSAVTRGAHLACTIGGADIAQCRVERIVQQDSGSDARGGGAVGDLGAGASGDPLRYADLVPADGTAIPAAAANAPASATAVLAAIAVDALLVPAAAVADRGGSAGVVLRRAADGEFREVHVTIVGAAAGQVAVTGDLAPGDEVRVG
ncbi:peptidoglycan-binding domain-containing protein [Microbacterium sp.]|uniref:peptidoglycan-binding domain-containing protein n=1 Tax=Microbacterium sp. TaxID=51671 RepID=UPI003A8DFBA3